MSVDPQGPDGTEEAELHPGGRDAEGYERVMNLTPVPRIGLYVTTGKRS